MFTHRDCGKPIELVVRCTDGHELASTRAIGGEVGPRRAAPGIYRDAGVLTIGVTRPWPDVMPGRGCS